MDFSRMSTLQEKFPNEFLMIKNNFGKQVKLKVLEQKQDLFSMPINYSLLHCVSQDLKMGKGIAVEFKKRFGRVHLLREQNAGIGGIAELDLGSRYIYYLITKKCFFHKPTYESIILCLISLKNKVVKNNIKKLAMPAIGCGLDQLKWNIIRELINIIFENVDVEIVVCFRKRFGSVNLLKEQNAGIGGVAVLTNIRMGNFKFD